MRSVDKIALLNSLEDKVDRHMAEAIKNFQNMTEEELLLPASNGGWSIAQCLEHLNRYGQYYLPQIKYGLDNYRGVPRDSFKSSWLGRYFTKMMDPRTGTGKIKAFKDYIPARELDAHAVVAGFINQQELLLSYLKQAKNVDLNSVWVSISIMKWLKLKLGDVFQFIIAHNERHLVQARKNISTTADSLSYSKEK